jgi:hypothetical protein
LLNKCARNDQARALGQKQTFQRNRHVRFTPESGHVQCINPCPLWAKSGRCKLYAITSAAARASRMSGGQRFCNRCPPSRM